MPAQTRSITSVTALLGGGLWIAAVAGKVGGADETARLLLVVATALLAVAAATLHADRLRGTDGPGAAGVVAAVLATLAAAAHVVVPDAWPLAPLTLLAAVAAAVLVGLHLRRLDGWWPHLGTVLVATAAIGLVANSESWMMWLAAGVGIGWIVLAGALALRRSSASEVTSAR
ncbi:MAG: hypothetical protein KY469_09900 [Actinobacteria bacterium]|nr:hypothetical protein [Actinomycetota bacterium]